MAVTLAATTWLAGCGGGGADTAKANPPTSFIIFYTDDHGFADIGVQGVDTDVRTPNIDALARSGVLATEGYVTAPQCTPSRAGMMTGIHQNRFGLDSNREGALPSELVTIAERLKERGYVTGMAGKWHLDGTDPSVREPKPREYSPGNQGFMEYYEGTNVWYRATHNTAGQPMDNAPAEIRDPRHRVDVATEWAQSFIKRNANKPFLLYVPYFAPHLTHERLAKYEDRFGHVSNETRKLGLAMLSAVDDGVGAILGEVERAGLSKQVVVLFIGDNGAPVTPNPKTALWDGSLNNPLIGEKGMLTDGGIKVPFVVAWPGRIPKGQVYHQPISTLDVAPTLLAAAGIAPAAELEGVNLMPYLTGLAATEPHDALFWRFGTQAAVRAGRWKLLVLGDEKKMLFDMNGIAPETVDVSADHPEIVNDLQARLTSWAATLKRPGMPQGKLTSEERNWYQVYGLMPKESKQ